ncbi:MAG TPA: hypothetical protein VJU86_06055 [Pyrinomonadaceae bacterium]|nr:hypothetical protein [Pyrinomonadaceae bacterium]
MTRWMRRFVLLVCAVALHSTLIVRAQDSRANQELNAFVKKVEEGDTLFNQKKYAEAAASLAAAHALYQRANRRDENIGGSWLTIQPQIFPALRYYGYLKGPDGSLKGEMADTIKETAAVLHNASILMWRDASILSDAAQGPLSTAFSDPPMEDLTEDRLLSVADDLYGVIRRTELPVPDSDWRDVVVAGRHAQLIMEHLLQKYPAWRSKQINWIGQPTGNQVLAEIKKKLAEAETEYKALVATPVVKDCSRDAVTNVHLTDLGKTRKEAEEFRPGLRDYYVSTLSDRKNLYLEAALSPSRRKEWLGESPEDFVKCMEPALDGLAAVARKTLPGYTGPRGYTLGTPAEKNALLSAVNDIAQAKVLKVGIDEANWLIDKNSFGLPTARYKHGVIWAQYPNRDDGFCRILWVNIKQDYAGGGTYGASYGYFVSRAFAGCPAGK